MKTAPPEESAVERSRQSLGALNVPAARPAPFRRSYRQYGCGAATVIAVAVVLAPVGYAAYAWYAILRPPREVAYEEWPSPLKARHAEWKEAGVDVDGMEVYVAAEFIDRDCYCRVHYSPETWSCFRGRYESKGDLASARRLWEQVRRDAPDWAPNLDSPDVEILPIEAYREGERFHLAVDRSRQTIYINYVFIFSRGVEW